MIEQCEEFPTKGLTQSCEADTKNALSSSNLIVICSVAVGLFLAFLVRSDPAPGALFWGDGGQISLFLV